MRPGSVLDVKPHHVPAFTRDGILSARPVLSSCADLPDARWAQGTSDVGMNAMSVRPHFDVKGIDNAPPCEIPAHLVRLEACRIDIEASDHDNSGQRAVGRNAFSVR